MWQRSAHADRHAHIFPWGTPAERRPAAAWAAVLGIPADRIGRRDHFFDRGGTSLAAVQPGVAPDLGERCPDTVYRTGWPEEEAPGPGMPAAVSRSG